VPSPFPPPEPVKTRGAFARNSGAAHQHDSGHASYVNAGGTALAFSIRDLGRNGRAGELVADHLLRIFKEATTSMLDDLAEVWWRAEHEGARTRPFASLPIADRAELRARVKKLLAERVPEALGDQAVLEAETQRLLALPALALARAQSELERRAERDRTWRGEGAVVEAILFAAGQASIAHVGDGHVVRVRRGRLEPLTRAHTLQNMFVDANPGEPVPEHVPEGVLVRALGAVGDANTRGTQVDTVIVPVEKGDVVLAVTGSLMEQADDAALLNAVLRYGVEAAPRLVADLSGRAVKNLSAVAVEIR
jgi:serine/threonine protein phosphatase PrpC